MEIHKNKAGLILGSFLGLLHLLWSVLVATGLSQALLDFIFKLHFLNNPFTLQSFDVGTAALLVVMTAVIGYIVGWFLAFLWNKFHH